MEFQIGKSLPTHELWVKSLKPNFLHEFIPYIYRNKTPSTMFDEILQAVKEHLGNNPEVAANLTPEQADAVHNEIANHIANNVPAAGEAQGLIGGLLGKLESSMAAGGPVTGAIEGSLVNSLTTKFGLPPSVTGAIAGALPSLLQRFARSAQPQQQ
jgi:hypothetical protein